MYLSTFLKNEYLTSTCTWYIFGVLGQLYLTPTLTLTQFRDINMSCQNVIFQKTKDGAQLRKSYNLALFREHFHEYFAVANVTDSGPL